MQCIPVQRNRHGPEPRPNTGPQGTTPDGVSGPCHAPDLTPRTPVDAMDVDQRRGGEHGHMRSTQDGLEVMRGKRGAEENEKDGECGRCEKRGQSQRDQCWLLCAYQITSTPAKASGAIRNIPLLYSTTPDPPFHGVGGVDQLLQLLLLQ